MGKGGGAEGAWRGKKQGGGREGAEGGKKGSWRGGEDGLEGRTARVGVC